MAPRSKKEEPVTKVEITDQAAQAEQEDTRVTGPTPGMPVLDFNLEDLKILYLALQGMDIKGKDAMRVVNIMTKIQQRGMVLEAQAAQAAEGQ